MRKASLMLVFALSVAMSVTAFAELQNVIVGGDIRIRGSYYSAAASGDGFSNRNPSVNPWWYNPGPFSAGLLSGAINAGNPTAGLRWPAGIVPFRPVGGRGAGIGSAFSWTDEGQALKWIEQRTKINVRADFTNDVSAFIELDSYDIWGEDFRSGYITAGDVRSSTGITADPINGAVDGDVEVYQAYIEANEMFGYPLRLRIGRQEMELGSEWLIGNNDTAALFRGLSYDGIRATYATDMFSIDAFYAKLAERGPIEEDGDLDLYGIYGSYLGVEDITIDAYWLFVRDGVAIKDRYAGIIGEWLEDIFGVDDYDPTTLHTFGLRGAGTIGAFDFEAEAAYQTGTASTTGALFGPPPGWYGDDQADYDAFAFNVEVGYTFDMQYTPRIYLGAAYFGGEDQRDVTFFEWLAERFWPFYTADASVSFNRLFSDWEYTEFFANGDMSNVWILRGGVSAMPTESVEVSLVASYFNTVEEFDEPFADYFLLGVRRNWLSRFSFLTEEVDSYLGTEVGLYVTYAYSEDLSFEFGYAHLFVGDGLSEGQFSGANGLGFLGGSGDGDDDADYVYLETSISF